MSEQIESAGTSNVVVEEEKGSGHVDVSNRKCDATGVESAITLEDQHSLTLSFCYVSYINLFQYIGTDSFCLVFKGCLL